MSNSIFTQSIFSGSVLFGSIFKRIIYRVFFQKTLKVIFQNLKSVSKFFQTHNFFLKKTFLVKNAF